MSILTIEAYHGTGAWLAMGEPTSIAQQFQPSTRGTFGSGIYWGNLQCAKEWAMTFEDPTLLKTTFSTEDLLICDASYDVGERNDVDTPAIPLLMKLFNETEEKATARWLTLHDEFLLGDEIRVQVQALGFKGILAQYQPDVFELVWYPENPMAPISKIPYTD